MLKDMYVDDLPTGANDEETAFEIYRRSKEIMKEGVFNLRKWKSSSRQLSQRINSCERVDESIISDKPTSSKESNVSEGNQTYAKSMIGSQLSDDSKIKILGVHWHIERDELYYEFDEILRYARTLAPTKRSVLKLVTKLFDPLGFLIAFNIRCKIMVQLLCKEKIEWDEELQGEMHAQYYIFIKGMRCLSGISIPRCHFSRSSKPVEFQLHGFSDVSEKAFGAVGYLHTKYDDGVVHANFVESKCRVSPIKKQSMPRPEQLGATTLVRLVESVSSSLNATLGNLEKTYWVDSLPVLCWIKNNRPWKQYVS